MRYRRSLAMTIDCPCCGGSGGGDDYWRCTSCRGSGVHRVDPDNYGVCEMCEETTHNDCLNPCEDQDKDVQVCDDCVEEHGLTCPWCECHFLVGVEFDGDTWCTKECVMEWADENLN